MHGLDLIGLEYGTYGQCGVPDGPRVKSQEIRWHFARSVGATLFLATYLSLISHRLNRLCTSTYIGTRMHAYVPNHGGRKLQSQRQLSSQVGEFAGVMGSRRGKHRAHAHAQCVTAFCKNSNQSSWSGKGCYGTRETLLQEAMRIAMENVAPSTTVTV